MSIDFTSTNTCNFIGYINEIPELQKTENGTPYMNFDLSVVRFYKKKDGSEGKERTPVPCEVWDSAAQFISEKVQPGDKVWVTTSLRKLDGKFVFRVNKFKPLKKRVNA